MKSKAEIEAARKAVAKAIRSHVLRHDMLANLSGMLVALCWVCDSPYGSTLQRLIDGEPIKARRRHDA